MADLFGLLKKKVTDFGQDVGNAVSTVARTATQPVRTQTQQSQPKPVVRTPGPAVQTQQPAVNPVSSLFNAGAKIATANPFSPINQAVKLARTEPVRQVASTVDSALQRSPIKKLYAADKAIVAGGYRSGTGTLQGASGLVDLATPGTGTSQVSKQLNRQAEGTDRFVKQQNLPSLVYKGAQLGTDALTGYAAGAAARVPAQAPRAITQLTKPLVNGNFAQRVAGQAARTIANPALQAGNLGYAALDAGKTAAQGRQVTPLSVSTNLAVGAVGVPVAGAIARETLAPVTSKAIGALRNGNVIAPSRLNPQQVDDLKFFNNARGTYNMDDQTYARGIAAAERAGVNPNDADAVNRLIVDHQIYNDAVNRAGGALQNAGQRLDSMMNPQGLAVGGSTRRITDTGDNVATPLAQQLQPTAQTPAMRLPGEDIPLSINVQSRGGNKQIPVSRVEENNGLVRKTNVKTGKETRYALNEAGELIPDTKGAYRLFKDKNGNVTQFRIGDELHSIDELGNLGSVNGYGSTLASPRRNLERAFDDKDTAAKVTDFVVGKQQKDATAMINRQAELKKELQGVADDLGINFGIGRRNAKKVSAAIQDYGEKNRDYNSLVKEFGQTQADKIVNADKFFRNRYDSLLDEANATLTKYGYDPIPKRDNYYTHFQDPSLFQKFGLKMQEINQSLNPTLQDTSPNTGRASIPNKLAGESEYLQPNKRFNPFAQQRKGGEYTADAFGAFERYQTPTLNNIYMTPSISRARVVGKAIANDADLVGKDANATLIQLKEYANSLSGKSSRLGDRQLADTMNGRKVLNALQFVQRRAGANTIVGNFATAALQPIVLSQTIGKFGGKNFLLAAAQELSSSHAADAAIRKSDFLRRRYADLSQVTRGKLQRGADIASTPLKVIEETSARITWQSAYNDALSKGMKGEQAIKYADIGTEKTLAGRSVGEKPELFNSKAAGAATMYQLEVANFVQQIGKEMTPAQAAKTLAAAYVFNLGLQEVTGRQVGFNPIQAGIDNYKETQKQEKTRGEKAKSIIQRDVGEVVDNLPFVGQFSTALAGNDNVKKILGPSSNIGRFGASSPVAALASNGAYSLLPFGGGQVKKTKEGIQAVAAGKLTNKKGETTVDIPQTPGNYIKAGLFGKNALDEVNTYNKNNGLKKTDQIPVPNQTRSLAGNQSLMGLTQDQQEVLNSVTGKEREAVLADFRGENKNKRADDKVKEEAKKTNDNSKLTAVDQLEKDKKAKAQSLKATLSSEDYKLSKLSKKDRQKLIDNGSYTQEKFDGLDNYVYNQKKKIGIDTGTAKTAKINVNTPAEQKQFLDAYSKLSKDQRRDASNQQNDFDYKYAVAKYENDKKNGKLSAAEDITARNTVEKELVGKDFSKEVRELYTKSKGDLYDYVTAPENGKDKKKIADDLIKYGDALAKAGLGKSKFRTSKGALAFSDSDSTKKYGKGGKKKSGRKASTAGISATNYSGTASIGRSATARLAQRKYSSKTGGGSVRQRSTKAAEVKVGKGKKQGARA